MGKFTAGISAKNTNQDVKSLIGNLGFKLNFLISSYWFSISFLQIQNTHIQPIHCTTSFIFDMVV